MRPDADGRPEITFVLWTPFTEPAKKVLAHDRYYQGDPNPSPEVPYELPYARAKLNEQLKTKLLNECLTDAVIYAGCQGDPIRQVPILNLAGATSTDPEDGSWRTPFRPRGGPLQPELEQSRRPHEAPPAEAAGEALAFLAEARGAPLPVASFYDPNDLLSYRLSPGYLPEQVRRDVQITNVAVSNSSVLLGLGTNPLESHLSYGANEDVIDILINGRR
jgi:hypothetical protein